MLLPKEFDVRVFAHSDTAVRMKIANVVTPEAKDNLQALFDNVLKPLAAMLPGQINITSAYRCDKLNAAVGGKPTSQHSKGEAADMEYREGGVEVNKVMIDKILASGLVFDQLILEKGSRGQEWVHVSYKKNGKNRMQYFKLNV